MACVELHVRVTLGPLEHRLHQHHSRLRRHLDSEHAEVGVELAENRAGSLRLDRVRRVAQPPLHQRVTHVARDRLLHFDRDR